MTRGTDRAQERPRPVLLKQAGRTVAVVLSLDPEMRGRTIELPYPDGEYEIEPVEAAP